MPAVAAAQKKVPSVRHHALAHGPDLSEVVGAIRRAFFADGKMIVRHLYTLDGAGRYRVNWYRDSEMGPYIHESRFVLVRQMGRRPEVQDLTATRARSTK